jgi:hypothetical protein
MKPLFDLKDPRVQMGVAHFEKLSKKAYEISKHFESSACPLYAFDPRLPTQSRCPLLIGSGVLVKIKNNYFVFSAAHVIENYRNSPIIIGCGNKLHFLTGDSFKTKRGPSGNHSDDPIDASVFHIIDQVPSEIMSVCLSWEDLDFNPDEEERFYYVGFGFSAKKSTVKRNEAYSHPMQIVSIEVDNDIYEDLEIKRSHHLVLAGETQINFKNEWRTAPSLRGTSGGAIIKVGGVPWKKLTSLREPIKGKSKLSAILIEHNKKQKKYETILCIRIAKHLELIDHFLPNLRK